MGPGTVTGAHGLGLIIGAQLLREREHSVLFTPGYFVAEQNTSGEKVCVHCLVDVDGQPCNQLVKMLQGNTAALRKHLQTHKNAFTASNDGQ